uniref:Rab-GAP TBC domain-containing protein n=1 Tax=Syphacia muris TaxID=451379 RepID=A0A0N5ATD8_9BILA
MSLKYKERLARFEAVLKTDDNVIDIGVLRRLCENGIEECLRPLCWRILLGYMPLDRKLWSGFLRKQRETFEALVQEIIVEPGKSSNADGLTVADDHPLSLNSNSEWKEYFKDNELLLQIDKDVRRLCPEIEFFQRTTNFPCKCASKSLSKRISQESLQAEICDKRYAGMSTGSVCFF